MAQSLDLPNWSHASSPCLRSRLAFGVHAVEKHLRLIENAEKCVRGHITTSVSSNLRVSKGDQEMMVDPSGVLNHQLSRCVFLASAQVRMLAGQRAAVELDESCLGQALASREAIQQDLSALGFQGEVVIRPFRSGSLSRSQQSAS